MTTIRGQGAGTSAEYVAARIKRDAPEVFERMKAGESKSVRWASINRNAGGTHLGTPRGD
jgi:hypothetical protein